MMSLTDSDLRFLVETVATKRRDYDRIIELVRDKDDLLEPMLDEQKLVDRLLQEQNALVRISPYLLFSILLRQVRRELQKVTYVYEVGPKGRRIPIFEAGEVARLLSKPESRDYLVEMLCSFTKANSNVLYWREKGTWFRRRFSDIDLDDMIQLCRLVSPDLRPTCYQRIAEIALFLAGIFPEHGSVFAARPKTAFHSRRTLQDYEDEGRKFYDLAAELTEEPPRQSVFKTFSENFTLARRALNTLSEHYLQTHWIRKANLPAN